MPRFAPLLILLALPLAPTLAGCTGPAPSFEITSVTLAERTDDGFVLDFKVRRANLRGRIPPCHRHKVSRSDAPSTRSVRRISSVLKPSSFGRMTPASATTSYSSRTTPSTRSQWSVAPVSRSTT